MTNLNFKVTDGDNQYVVRFGEEDPIHLISRANEVASSQAAFEVGTSPEPVHHEAGILVTRFIEGNVFTEADVRVDATLQRILELLKRFHRETPKRFNGIAVMFWVFQVLRHYQNLLVQGNSSHMQRLPELANISFELEAAVGPVEIVFGHNDLLAANFIDDGDRIWLIDFDYAGFNSPLFDLSNLASNNELDAAQETLMLQQYFDRAPDEATWAGYHAMKCASLLRETMWSMVSELHSGIDMDFAQYTHKNLVRFESVYAEYKNNYL
jgi:thiamine kinase-like enzyme